MIDDVQVCVVTVVHQSQPNLKALSIDFLFPVIQVRIYSHCLQALLVSSKFSLKLRTLNLLSCPYFKYYLQGIFCSILKLTRVDVGNVSKKGKI